MQLPVATTSTSPGWSGWSGNSRPKKRCASAEVGGCVGVGAQFGAQQADEGLAAGEFLRGALSFGFDGGAVGFVEADTFAERGGKWRRGAPGRAARGARTRMSARAAWRGCPARCRPCRGTAPRAGTPARRQTPPRARSYPGGGSCGRGRRHGRARRAGGCRVPSDVPGLSAVVAAHLRVGIDVQKLDQRTGFGQRGINGEIGKVGGHRPIIERRDAPLSATKEKGPPCGLPVREWFLIFVAGGRVSLLLESAFGSLFEGSCDV